MTLRVERITLETIPPFTLRQGDIDECAAAGMTPEIAVKRSVAGANAAYAHYIDDELVCLWGYRWGDYSRKEAVLWLLSTTAVDEHSLAFGRASRRLLRILRTEFHGITVLVHVHYTTSIKWLEWLGFKRGRAFTQHFIEMRI